VVLAVDVDAGVIRKERYGEKTIVGIDAEHQPLP
jgi:hypothetical protein